MNKKQLIEHIAHVADLNQTDAKNTLNALIETITDTLSTGDDVILPGFGTFKVTHRPARKGRNPQTGEVLDIAATNAPVFKAGKTLKESVNP